MRKKHGDTQRGKNMQNAKEVVEVEKLLKLVERLNRFAGENADKASQFKDSEWLKGFHTGEKGGYELSARFLKRVIDEYKYIEA